MRARFAAMAVMSALVGLAGLAGCSGGAFESAGGTVSKSPGVTLTGKVRGGQQAIVGAHVYLFAANTTGYGGNGIAGSASNASVSLLTSGAGTTLDTSGGATNGDYYVTTDASGNWTITGDYTCTTGQQVYLYALGGDPGLGTGVNPAAGLMAALGSCPAGGNFLSGTSPISYVVVNEVSTVAAAYAMAGFATDASHVGSSGTTLALTGIANAFANAANLETLGTGVALATTPAGNGAVPQSEINTLANILASCVNSNGAVTGPTNATACYTLFTNALAGGTTGAQPSDTATAAINIAHNPEVGIAALYGLATANPPFTPQLTVVPNDFSVALAFTGGGGGLAIDGTGNVWMAGASADAVSELSALGAPLSGPGGYKGGGLDYPDSIAIDASGNVWVVNYFGTGITELSSSGAAISPAAGFTAGGYDQPESLAIDSAGNVWANSGGAIMEWSNNGTVLSPSHGYVLSAFPQGPAGGTAVDTNGNVWLGEDVFVEGVAELSNTGSIVSPSLGFTGGGLHDTEDIAIDASGHVWVTNFDGPVSELSSTGTPMPGSPFSGVGSGADQLAIDGSGNVWVSSYGSPGGIWELSNSGAPLSPSAGFSPGLIGGLYQTGDVVVDGSGNVWVSSNGVNGVIELVGIATPVVTPLAVGVKNNTLGTRP